MSADPTPFWVVMTAAATLQLLGSSLSLLLLRGRHISLCLASGLLWGTAVCAGFAALLVFGRHALGAAPLFHTGAICAVALLAAIASVAACQLRATHGDAAPSALAAWQAAAALAVAAGVRLLMAFDLSTLTPDSLGIIESGLALARVDDPGFVGLPFLGRRGVFGVLLQAPAAALPFGFLWFVVPALGLACLATLAAASGAAIRETGRSRGVAALVATVGIAWLLGCYFWVYQLFYVHVNLLASAYLLLFFYSAWRSLVDADEAWTVLAGLALLAFQMLRVEGSLFAALFVGVLVLERAAAGRPRGPDLWLALPGALWCGLLAATIEPGAGIVDRTRLLWMGASLLGAIPLGRIARLPALERRGNALPGAAVGMLAVGVLALFALSPAHMIERLRILALNALGEGLWSTAWVLIPAFVLAGPLLGRVPQQRFIQLGLTAYFLGLMGLTYAGYWREGWWDSGNRMLTHALPTLVWLGMLRSAAIVPSTDDSNNEQTSAPSAC